MREHGTLHIPDVRAQTDFPMLGSAGGWRTFLAVPLRQQGELIGILNARRIEVRPFTPAQIELLETFADQAVIAIENVRLFQELKESWNSRLRRVKSWESSPARRRIFSRCWMSSPKTRRGFATRRCAIIAVEGDLAARRGVLWIDRVRPTVEKVFTRLDQTHLDERCSTDKRFTSMTIVAERQ